MNAFNASSSALQLFSSAFNYAVSKHHGVALWAQPGSENFHLLIDQSPSLQKQKTSWHNGDKGFILHSFLDKASEQSLLLKPDILFQLHTLSKEDTASLKDYTSSEHLDFPFHLLESLDFSEEEQEQNATLAKSNTYWKN